MKHEDGGCGQQVRSDDQLGVLSIGIAAMQKAAEILLREADALKAAHTIGDDWTDAHEARQDYDEMIGVAFDLRQSADDSMFAHRLAHELECVLLDYHGRWWDRAMTVLSEYRDIESRISQRECPTQFGEPVQMCPRPINTGPDEQAAAECIANGDCGCIYGPDRA